MDYLNLKNRKILTKYQNVRQIKKVIFVKNHKILRKNRKIFVKKRKFLVKKRKILVTMENSWSKIEKSWSQWKNLGQKSKNPGQKGQISVKKSLLKIKNFPRFLPNLVQKWRHNFGFNFLVIFLTLLNRNEISSEV